MYLIIKFVPVDRASSSASPGWIPCLDHEVWNDAMNDDVVVVSSLRQTCEVFACLRRMVIVQLNNDGTLYKEGQLASGDRNEVIMRTIVVSSTTSVAMLLSVKGGRVLELVVKVCQL